jgi:replicative DNA helicase
MEMSIEALAMRAISGESKVGSRQMRTGRINDEMYSQIKATVNRIRKYPIRMSTAKINPTELRASLNHLTREYGIGWFVIDYLGLMSGFERETERFERIGALATSVKQIINDFDIAGLVLSSVNKTGMQTGQAAMTDMSGSGSVPHDADVILKLIKPADQPDVISLKILKTRDNDLGAGTINFRNAPNTMWFGNLKKVELNVDNHSPKTMF